jgi:hypothetical protein
VHDMERLRELLGELCADPGRRRGAQEFAGQAHSPAQETNDAGRTTPMASPNLSGRPSPPDPLGSSACSAVSAWTRCTSTWVWESVPRPSGPPESPVVGGDRSRG